MRPLVRLAWLLVAIATRANAQAELQGHVFADSTRRPLAAAEISIARLNLRAMTDSLGRYRLQNIPRGEYLVITRAAGFRPDSASTPFDGDEAIVTDVVLSPEVTTLPTVPVRATSTPLNRAKMVGYDERKALGAGHFIEHDLLEKEVNQKLGDVLSARVPGLKIFHGKELRAWAATGRTTKGAGCALCGASADALDPADIFAGAPLACYLDVYLDGIQVYNSQARAMPLFNLNSLAPDDIEAIEVYTGPSQVPPMYNRTASMCGVMLIWLRDRR